MSKYIRRLGAPVALVAVAALAACRSDAKRADSTALGADTHAQPRSRARESRQRRPAAAEGRARQRAGEDAGADAHRSGQEDRAPDAARQQSGAASDSAGRVVPTTTPSGNTVTTNPGAAPRPAAGGGAVGTIAAGSTLNTHASSKICTNTNAVGDHVTATLDNAVSGSNGATIPAGATVNLTVTNLKRSENCE